jgi:hypothetical protein
MSIEKDHLKEQEEQEQRGAVLLEERQRELLLCQAKKRGRVGLLVSLITPTDAHISRIRLQVIWARTIKVIRLDTANTINGIAHANHLEISILSDNILSKERASVILSQERWFSRREEVLELVVRFSIRERVAVTANRTISANFASSFETCN